MRRFLKWEEAHAYAQAKANETGLSMGIYRAIEYGCLGFNVRFLPGLDKRFDVDGQGEVVCPRLVGEL